MSDLTNLEQQMFAAVQAALDQWAPQLHLSIAPAEPAIEALALAILTSAEDALKSGAITTGAAGIGTTLGTAAGAALGTAIGGPVGTGLGGTAGAALGTLIGTTLGSAFTSLAEQFLTAATQ